MSEALFSSFKLGRTIVPNRICLVAHRTNFAKGGVLNKRHIAYYRRRAEGGCGLVIIGELGIHPNDQPWESLIAAYRPEIVRDYHCLTDAIHEFDTRVFARLNHHGFQSSGHITRSATWGPSATADIVFGEVCKPMELEDISELVDAFSKSAVLVKQGGFDGVEIDIGPESILRQFLSPISNQRQDEYGGSLENRMRLSQLVLQAVRKAVGDDFTVGVCLCADEKFWGGITPEDSVLVARELVRRELVDFINVSVGTYYNLHMIMPTMHIPMGFTLETAEQIKTAVDIPVIASYHIGVPGMADKVISEGKADLVGFVRAMISDPDMAKKMREGRPDDIRYCVKDNKGCIGRIAQAKTLGCIQNPEVGYERPTGVGSPLQAENKKRVVVIGAGPSGMEAARAAHERGHDVVVYEKEEVVGGQINLIEKRPGRTQMGGVTRYLKHTLDSIGVPVRTGVEVTVDQILKEAPDAVIVATGSVPVSKPFAGDYGPPDVLTGRDVIQNTNLVGEKVLFIDEDGGHHAMATAELLAEQGKKVDLVTSDLFIGIELAPRGELYLGRQRLLQKGVTFRPDLDIVEIDTSIGGLHIKARNIYTNESIFFDDYDTVILDVGDTANDDLYHQLKGLIKEIYRIGDCVAPRGIDMAILEGRQAGERL